MAQIDITGRLGNQMFQYASIKGILAKINSDEKIYLNFKKRVYTRNFDNDLKNFNVNFEEIDKFDLNLLQFFALNITKFSERIINLFIKKGKQEYAIYNFEKKIAPILMCFGVYFMRQGYYDFNKNFSKNKVFVGKFESSKYFDLIREQLLIEFTPIYEKLKKNIPMYKKIEESNSVCVTIRRGDFLSATFKKDFYVCNPAYFNKAIEYMNKKIKNPKYFIFSDDIEWVKKNMSFPEGTEYESGNDPVWEKLRLMYSCKHFIISNSTFSWWAQYLSKNKDKVVLAPSKWRNTGIWQDIYQDNFIKIDI